MELILPQLFIFVLTALVTQSFIIPNYPSDLESGLMPAQLWEAVSELSLMLWSLFNPCLS